MRHPELVYLACQQEHYRLLELFYDAHCYYEKPVNKRILLEMKDDFLKEGYIPRFVEDYALEVLAHRAVPLDRAT